MEFAPLLRKLRPVATVLAFLLVSAGVVIGVRLAAGGEPEPFTPQLAPGDPPPSITPRPGTPDPGPSPDDFAPVQSAAPMDGLSSQPPLRVAGVDVPVPAGAAVSIIGPGLGVGADPDGPRRRIILGDSWVLFNEKGLIDAHVLPEDNGAFEATLEALATIGNSAR